MYTQYAAAPSPTGKSNAGVYVNLSASASRVMTSGASSLRVGEAWRGETAGGMSPERRPELGECGLPSLGLARQACGEREPTGGGGTRCR
jgi:hypothetical protein